MNSDSNCNPAELMFFLLNNCNAEKIGIEAYNLKEFIPVMILKGTRNALMFNFKKIWQHS